VYAVTAVIFVTKRGGLRTPVSLKTDIGKRNCKLSTPGLHSNIWSLGPKLLPPYSPKHLLHGQFEFKTLHFPFGHQ